MTAEGQRAGAGFMGVLGHDAVAGFAVNLLVDLDQDAVLQDGDSGR